MRSSESLFVEIRGLRYHVRHWGNKGAPKLFFLHGWMDVSASFQFLVDALRGEWQVLAPDWRGYGLTEWSGDDTYWFTDYIADLHMLLLHFQPDSPAKLVAHSMGGNIAGLYAGTRPDRVACLVNLEGFGMPGTRPEDTPGRYARWLEELGEDMAFRDYESCGALGDRLMKSNPRLSRERALFLADHWGRRTDEGRVALRSDPVHKRVNPVLYRVDEARACWEKITAPVLWVEGEESDMHKRLRLSAQELADRKGSIRVLTEHVLPGAGHMMHHDQPEKLAEIIESFLGGTGN